MFQIGDRIVYPTHGAGIVEAIEDREIQGVTKQYYIMKLSIQNLQIMVPVGNEEKLGLRPVMDQDGFNQLVTIFKNGETDDSLSCKERLKINAEKIKSGIIRDRVEVVRDLERINDEKPLNSSEKKMLNKAKELIQSELVLVNGLTDSEKKLFS